jgi:predicted nucleic acid-binding protein
MRIVCDSSTLILLEKVKLLEVILKENEVVIPKEVYNEAVLKGKKSKYPDSYGIEKRIKRGLIKVVEIKDKNKFKEIRESFNLAEGETEAVVLLHENRGDIIALDDLKAMKYCNYSEIPFVTTINLLLDSFDKKLISKQAAKEMVKNLGTFGRYKDEIIFYALDYLEESLDYLEERRK